jgi:hypothetical protein
MLCYWFRVHSLGLGLQTDIDLYIYLSIQREADRFLCISVYDLLFRIYCLGGGEGAGESTKAECKILSVRIEVVMPVEHTCVGER